MSLTPEHRALKAAFGQTVKGVGGFEAAAEFCRVGKTVLNDQASQNSDRFPAIDVIADLEPLARDRAGWPHVTRALCTAMGGAFVLLPEGRPDTGDVHSALGRVVKEHGEAVATVIDGFADRKAMPDELERALKELREMIEAGVQLDALLARMLMEAR